METIKLTMQEAEQLQIKNAGDLQRFADAQNALKGGETIKFEIEGSPVPDTAPTPEVLAYIKTTWGVKPDSV